jgi:hypothetical protein
MNEKPKTFSGDLAHLPAALLPPTPTRTGKLARIAVTKAPSSQHAV